MKLNKKTKMIVEGAMMIALAWALDTVMGFIPFLNLPNGGTVSLKLVPIVFFCVRYGCGWGALMGFVFGLADYFLGFPKAIDWTSILFDYFISFTLLGFGAGLMKKVKLSAVWGSIVGGFLMFLSNYIVGVYIWGEYMPDMFFGMTMTSPWFYSLLYNGAWAGGCIVFAVVAFVLLYQIKPVAKLLNGEDLK